jgi:hypothetical protein
MRPSPSAAQNHPIPRARPPAESSPDSQSRRNLDRRTIQFSIGRSTLPRGWSAARAVEISPICPRGDHQPGISHARIMTSRAVTTHAITGSGLHPQVLTQAAAGPCPLHLIAPIHFLSSYKEFSQ